MRVAEVFDDTVSRVVVVPDDVPTPQAFAAAVCVPNGGAWVADAETKASPGFAYLLGDFWLKWFQIEGAGGGPAGAEDGFPVGFEAARDGIVWRSRTQFNVNEPRSDGVPTTWSRVDGRFVVPAGWEYQPGEDLTADDGATWWRVTQATSFSPTDFPAAYVQIDGPGGDPLATTPAWVAPTGAHDAYALGAVVTHDGQTWTSTTANNIWEPGVFGWVAA